MIFHGLQRKHKLFYPIFKVLHSLDGTSSLFPPYLSLLPSKHLCPTQTVQASHSFLLAVCSLFSRPELIFLHVPNFCYSLRPSYTFSCAKPSLDYSGKVRFSLLRAHRTFFVFISLADLFILV